MRKLSARQVVILAIAITIIGVVMAWDGVAGALVLAVAIIALLTDWKPFARRPALRATLVRDGQRLDRVAVGGRERAIGAIDPVAIVAEQMGRGRTYADTAHAHLQHDRRFCPRTP